MEPVSDPTDPAFSEDRLLGGRVLLRQGVRGYRAGMDAALLAAACAAAGLQHPRAVGGVASGGQQGGVHAGAIAAYTLA